MRPAFCPIGAHGHSIRPYPAARVRRRLGGVLELIIGVALGTIVMGFLAIAAYERGFGDATYRRTEWRAELSARRRAHRSLVRRAAG